MALVSLRQLLDHAAENGYGVPAFNADANAVGHFNDLTRYVHVIVVRGNRLAIGLQGAVHHHGSKAHAHSTLANRGTLTMVLVHTNGHVGIRFNGRLDQVFQEND